MTDAELYRRISRLEALVARLYEHNGIEAPQDGVDGMPQEVVDIMRSGNTIAAIKRYRELTGCDLAYAKQQVEAIPY